MTRFAEQRKLNNYSQQQLANILFVNQTAVSQWDRGITTPSPPTLLKLSELYGVSTDYLLGNDTPPQRSSIKIPVLGSIPAGIPIEAIEDIIDWEEIPTSMCSGGREYFALLVKGDSMWPDYLPGDVIIVSKTPICESGDVCVVYVNGFEATLKQVKLGEDGSLTTVPRNQNYNPRTYSPEEIQSLPVSIAGVVVELRRKIK